MNFVSLVKVPFIIMIMKSERTCFEATNPVPTSKYRARFNGGQSDIFAATTTFWLPQLAVLLTSCFTLCEIAVIVARELPPPFSDSVLGVLLKHRDNADNLIITPTFIVGSILAVVGAVWRRKCYDALGRLFTFQLALHEEHKLVTTGPYAVVRHPSYTAVLMVELGCLIALMLRGSYVYESGMLTTLWGTVSVMSWGVMRGTMVSITLRRVPVEDAVLRREFGPQWDAWATKTPYALIPYVY